MYVCLSTMYISLPVIFKNFPASVFAVQWINSLAVFDSVGGDRNLGKRLSHHDQVIINLCANSLSSVG